MPLHFVPPPGVGAQVQILSSRRCFRRSGLAREGRERGDRFFDIHLEIPESARDVRFGEADPVIDRVVEWLLDRARNSKPMKSAAVLTVVVLALAATPNVQAATVCLEPLAHRGVHTGDVDENSIMSITRMKNKGAAEIDVHITKDGYPILMHDAAVNRTTTGSGLVHDLTLDQIKQLELEKSGEQVPTFREAVNAAEQANVSLVVDLKQYPQWTPELFSRVGQIASNADVRVYLGGLGKFATTVPAYTTWVYWRPQGIPPTPINAAEYGADLILARTVEWTRDSVTAAEAAGYVTGTRLTNGIGPSVNLGVGYMLTNRPHKVITYCQSLS